MLKRIFGSKSGERVLVPDQTFSGNEPVFKNAMKAAHSGDPIKFNVNGKTFVAEYYNGVTTTKRREIGLSHFEIEELFKELFKFAE